MLTEQQKQNRLRCIGASDAAAVLGKNPYCTPLEAYLRIMGLSKEEEKIGHPTYWGNMYEPIVAQHYENVTGNRLRYSRNTLRHRQHPFIVCHLDRKIANQRKSLECKTSGYAKADEWGPTGTDQIPLVYIIQVQHQMAITEYEASDVSVMLSMFDFRDYTVKRDDKIIKALINKECEFYENHILYEIPPEPICKDDVKLLYKEPKDDIIEATDEIAENVNKLAELKSQTKLITNQQKELENKIALYMLDNAVLLYHGKSILTWKFDRNKNRQMRVK